LKIALARLRERGDREAVGEGIARFARMKQPLTPASPYPLPLERAVINCDLAVNPNVQTPGAGVPPVRSAWPRWHATSQRVIPGSRQLDYSDREGPEASS
jgi:hypothetical protein